MKTGPRLDCIYIKSYYIKPIYCKENEKKINFILHFSDCFVVIIPTSPHADQLSVSEYRVSLLDLFFNNKNNNKKKHLKMYFDAIYCTLKSHLSLNVSGYVRSFNCHRVKTVYKVTL